MKHMCQQFKKIKDSYENWTDHPREIDPDDPLTLGRAMVVEASSYRCKSEMAKKLNRHLSRCRECSI